MYVCVCGWMTENSGGRGKKDSGAPAMSVALLRLGKRLRQTTILGKVPVFILFIDIVEQSSRSLTRHGDTTPTPRVRVPVIAARRGTVCGLWRSGSRP